VGARAGTPLREALIEAGAIRLRPILMTTFALIAGMIPVALGRGEGAQFRAPMGRGGDRRRDHLDAADAAGDPHHLRDLRDLFRRKERPAHGQGRGHGSEGRRPVPASRLSPG
jgi:HAE1 family hydrophobic/amphiphilic exporter-1